MTLKLKTTFPPATRFKIPVAHVEAAEDLVRLHNESRERKTLGKWAVAKLTEKFNRTLAKEGRET